MKGLFQHFLAMKSMYFCTYKKKNILQSLLKHIWDELYLEYECGHMDHLFSEFIVCGLWLIDTRIRLFADL